MQLYEFTVLLDRSLDDDDYKRLYEAGLDDTTPGVENGQGFLMVSRQAESLPRAVVSIADDAQRAGFAIVGVRDEDLLSLRTIAARVGRSYESLRLLAAGKRGPGGFPASPSTDGWAVYSWVAVARWFEQHHFVTSVSCQHRSSRACCCESSLSGPSAR
ncbi:MAG: hypothetical protein JWQ64_3664 [Subtercola sp.]|nr:hypothetical protein [Subtercola sp.]